MFPTLILSSFVGVTLPEEVVDRLVSTRTVVIQRQVKLEVVLCKGDPLGSKEAGTLEVLTRPTLWLTHKQTGFFQTEPAAGQGITFRATPCLRLDGRIGIDCETNFTTVNHGRGLRTASGFIPGLDSEVVKSSTVVATARPHKVRLSAKSATEQTWIEMTATVVEDPHQELAAEAAKMTWSVRDTAYVTPAILPVLPAAVPPPALLPAPPKSK